MDIELTKGNVVSIKLKAIGELQPNGTREVGSGRLPATGRRPRHCVLEPWGTPCRYDSYAL